MEQIIKLALKEVEDKLKNKVSTISQEIKLLTIKQRYIELLLTNENK